MWVLFLVVPPTLGCVWISFEVIQVFRAQSELVRLVKGDPNARITEVAFDSSVQVNGQWEGRTTRIDSPEAMDWLSATVRSARPFPLEARIGADEGHPRDVWVRLSSGGMINATIYTTLKGEVLGVAVYEGGICDDATHYAVSPAGPPPPELLPCLTK
jgi:hypothetical protein